MKKIIIAGFLVLVSCAVFAQSDSLYFTPQLASFEVTSSNNIARLYWKAICFLDYANFRIEKSVDGKNFTTIHSLVADKVRCQQPFNFTDTSLSESGIIFYRINIGSIDGNFYQSAIRNVSLREKEFNLTSVYPTIATSNINFSIANNNNEKLSILIINQSGNIVKQKDLMVPKGLSNYNIEVNALPRGYYWLEIINNQKNLRTAKFLKQ